MKNQKEAVKIVVSKPNAIKFEFVATDFNTGLIEARRRYESMGLVGRYYVIGSDGSHAQV